MLLKDIETKFPFLSIVQYGGNEYVGIINNQDNYFEYEHKELIHPF